MFDVFGSVKGLIKLESICIGKTTFFPFYHLKSSRKRQIIAWNSKWGTPFKLKIYLPFFSDNNVFRLHYKGTFIILVVASLLVTSRQYIGDPIDCIVEEIPNNVSIIRITYLQALICSTFIKCASTYLKNAVWNTTSVSIFVTELGNAHLLKRRTYLFRMNYIHSFLI